jgi:uncharacterized protein (UPF0332 family)
MPAEKNPSVYEQPEMDKTEEQMRWETAQELHHAADAVFHQQRYKACTGLAYYACFQAMWVALGDPPTGEWRHVGITRRFCHGQWATRLHYFQTASERYTSDFWRSMNCDSMHTIVPARFLCNKPSMDLKQSSKSCAWSRPTNPSAYEE